MSPPRALPASESRVVVRRPMGASASASGSTTPIEPAAAASAADAADTAASIVNVAAAAGRRTL